MAIGSPQWMYSSGDYELDQSLKFNDDDSAYLSWTPASAGNQRTWTWSGWVKRGELGSVNTIFGAGNGGTIFDEIRFDASDRLEWFTYASSVNGKRVSTAIYRDTSAWYHILAVYDSTDSTEADRMKLYVNGQQLTSFDATTHPSQNHQGNINNNILHAVGAVYAGQLYNPYDGYLAEVNFIDGQALTPADFGKTGTYGEWKPIEYSGTYGTNGFYLPFKQDYTVEGFSTVTYKGNGVSGNYIGGVGFKPDFTWVKMRSHADNHVLSDSVRGQSSVLYSNLTNAETTSANFVTARSSDGFSVGTDPSVNYSAGNHVAWNWDMGADTPTGFGAVTYTGNGSTQNISGFNFSPDLVWIKSRSAAENNSLFDSIRGISKYLFSNQTSEELTFSNNGLTSFDSDGFEVTGGSGYAVNTSSATYVSWGWDMGNTTVTNTSGSENSTVRANPTYGQSIVSYVGKEVAGTTYGHGLNSAPEFIIVKNRSRASDWKVYYGDNTKALALNTTGATDDQTYYWNDTSPTSSVFTVGGGTDTNGNDENLVAYCFHSVSGYSKFGSYTGNGNLSGTSVTLGFRPAWVMIRKTDSADWLIFDSTRNPLNEVRSFLEPNTTDAETIEQTTNYELGIDFDDNGFQIKARGGGMNSNGSTYVYAAFAGGMDSISDYNTDGSIDSRVKANPTYGQSIVSYTGTGSAATVGHGLSSAPELIIVKNRDYVQDWAVYDSVNGSGYFLRLNDTNARQATTTAWNNDATSSVFGVGNWTATNKSGDNHIAYCFHSVTGYSKIGSYTGNGSSTGASVTTNFPVGWIMIKNSSSTGNWRIYDNTRDPSNPNNRILYANESEVDQETAHPVDLLSDGFQIKGTNADINTSGNNYIYMAFADKREYAYWLDQSGNNNDWTSNNLTESDISVDSPTNNFATWNPLDKGDQVTVAEGNTQLTFSGTAGHSIRSTFSMSSGKWYCEIYVGDNSSLGIIKQNAKIVPSSGSLWPGANGFGSGGSYAYAPDGRIVTNSSYSSYGTNPVAGDILGIAFDSDNGKIYFSLNGVWQNSSNPESATNPAYTGISGTFAFAAGYWTTPGSNKVILNCGQDSSFAGNKTAQGNQDSNDIGDFYYTPPTGFLALCTKNLPDVDVVPSEHFNTVLYTGNGSDNRSIGLVGFQPDWLWIKERSSTSSHILSDAVRGATKQLKTNSTGAESSNADEIQAFESDGFQLGTEGSVNENTQTYVAWNWKANGSGSSNTNGSITSTVSANVDAGFSIVSYTGDGSSLATIGHGLSKAPELIHIKNRTDSDSWISFTTVIDGSLDYMYLNLTNAKADLAIATPTSSVFSVDSGNQINGSGDAHIAYCFHSVDGYSKVGSYTGNGNVDGTFVYTGFRPAWVMLKKTGNAANGSSWVINDSKRLGYNNDNPRLRANTSGQEDDTGRVELLSNGFKMRVNYAESNEDGVNFIYIAFAETPFKNSNAR